MWIVECLSKTKNVRWIISWDGFESYEGAATHMVQQVYEAPDYIHRIREIKEQS